MAVNALVLDAYRRQLFSWTDPDTLDTAGTQTSLLALQAQALADHENHVAITSFSYADGGSTGGQLIEAKPERLLEITEQLLKEVDAIIADPTVPHQEPDRVYHLRHSQRPFES